MKRRDFVKTLGAGFAMGYVESTFAKASLKKNLSGATAGTIDCHSHIFNATDLPIKEFINTVKLKAPAWAPWRIIGDLVQKIGWEMAPSAKDELSELSKLPAGPLLSLNGPSTIGQIPLLKSWLQSAESASDARYHAFLTTLRNQYPERYKEFLVEYDKQAQLHATPEFKALINAESAETIITRALRDPKQLNEYLQLEAKGGLPAFSGLKPFFRTRFENANELLSAFGTSTDYPVSSAITALVDFDLWLGYEKKWWGCSRPDHPLGETKSSFSEQLQVALKLKELLGGRIRALAPFNPLRAAYDSNYVTLYQKAITDYGCVGFKLYPPMGFSPWDNASTVIPECRPKAYKKITAAKLDTTLKNFYEFCADQQVSIMAHCADSNEASDGSGKNASPDNWKKAIEAFPAIFGGENPKVRICLGHFGDDNSTQCGPTLGWTEKIVGLMQQHRCVYADFSYYDQLLGSDNDIRCLALRLKPLLNGPVLNQLVYGSDWSMLGMQRDWNSYHSRFLRLLGSGNLDLSEDQKLAICSSNARKLYQRF